MRLKKTSQTTDLVLALFLYIPVVWAALLIAQSLGGGLPELLSNLTAALEQPFQIQWTDKSLLSILVCTGAYLMGLCLYASGQGRTRDGEEHGSAAWGSPRQLNAQFRQSRKQDPHPPCAAGAGYPQAPALTECAGHWRQRRRQDPRLCQAQHSGSQQQLCDHGPEDGGADRHRRVSETAGLRHPSAESGGSVAVRRL